MHGVSVHAICRQERMIHYYLVRADNEAQIEHCLVCVEIARANRCERVTIRDRTRSRRGVNQSLRSDLTIVTSADDRALIMQLPSPLRSPCRPRRLRSRRRRRRSSPTQRRRVAIAHQPALRRQIQPGSRMREVSARLKPRRPPTPKVGQQLDSGSDVRSFHPY